MPGSVFFVCNINMMTYEISEQVHASGDNTIHKRLMIRVVLSAYLNFSSSCPYGFAKP